MGFVFTDEPDGILAQGVYADNIGDPNIFDGLESMLLQEAREMGERKVAALCKQGLVTLRTPEGSDN